MRDSYMLGIDTSEDMPTDSAQLIDKLDEAFPHRSIGRNESEIAAHRYAGRRALIDFLKNWRSEQNERARANAYSDRG